MKYGTASPVPFRVLDQRAGIDLDISLKAFGEYSIKISDPILSTQTFVPMYQKYTKFLISKIRCVLNY